MAMPSCCPRTKTLNKVFRCSLLTGFFWLAPIICCAGQLAIIIDDIGYSSTLGQRSVDLEGSFTLAVLPFTPYGVELAHRANRRGKELILHTPMSNNNKLPIERGALVSGMTHGHFIRALNQMLANIPHISGVNNHMGSRLTREQEPMEWLMRELADRQLYFIDSRTTAETVALHIALQHRIPSAKRDIFLDNQRDPRLIRAQLRKALELARAQGAAIAIGHPYPETLAVLEQIQPLLLEYQVKLVKVSELLANNPGGSPPVERADYCPAPPVLLWRPLTTTSTTAHSVPLPPIFLVMKRGARHANSIY